MVQFGISTIDPGRTKYWMRHPIEDDIIINSTNPLNLKSNLFTKQYPKHSNSRGTISFASAGPNTRACQLFINLVNNDYLDKQGFIPIGKIIYGAKNDKNKELNDFLSDENIIDELYTGYGDSGKSDGTDGKGPSQQWLLEKHSNKQELLEQQFPKISYIKSIKIL